MGTFVFIAHLSPRITIYKRKFTIIIIMSSNSSKSEETLKHATLKHLTPPPPPPGPPLNSQIMNPSNLNIYIGPEMS